MIDRRFGVCFPCTHDERATGCKIGCRRCCSRRRHNHGGITVATADVEVKTRTRVAGGLGCRGIEIEVRRRAGRWRFRRRRSAKIEIHIHRRRSLLDRCKRQGLAEGFRGSWRLRAGERGHLHGRLHARIRHFSRRSNGCQGPRTQCHCRGHGIGRSCRSTAKQRISRQQRAPEFSGTVPVITLTAGCRVQFLGVTLEGCRVGALAVNLHQLDSHGVTGGILGERFLEDFFRLGVAAIGHVDVRLGNRVDFVGIDRTRRHLAEVALERTVARIDILATSVPEHRIRLQVATSDDAVFELLDLALATHCICRIPTQQGQHPTATRKVQRIVDELVHQARFGWGWRRRRCRLLWFRLGRVRYLGRFRRLGRFSRLGWVRRFG